MLTIQTLAGIPRAGSGGEFEEFRLNNLVAMLNWPADVLRDWLWDHGCHVPFLDDYRTVDLTTIRWTNESVLTTELVELPTGPSEADCISDFAQNHEHWIRTRDHAFPEVRAAWEQEGTWARPPILLERSLINPNLRGLQVIEGRTRFGILRGRHAAGIPVAHHHSAWVGRQIRQPDDI
ncbi:hypothetical protein CHR55_26295 [Rhodococcus qingshengii]|uniref:Uncharacterized protein n=1 Tax=Rhodococcus qingshengii TaxID=334542 RepID=A0A2A5J474_RHOSG|nr:hypothetical protein CHR55_26295 [Rhodococcus qingshengii]